MKNNEWISVKDRLPEKSGKYLVVICFRHRKTIDTLWFDTNLSNILRRFNFKGLPINSPANNYNRPGFYEIDFDSDDSWEIPYVSHRMEIPFEIPYVSHWTELPELPEEEDVDEE